MDIVPPGDRAPRKLNNRLSNAIFVITEYQQVNFIRRHSSADLSPTRINSGWVAPAMVVTDNNDRLLAIKPSMS